MKKLLIILLVAMLVLTGCAPGNTPTSNEVPEQTSPAEETAPVETTPEEETAPAATTTVAATTVATTTATPTTAATEAVADYGSRKNPAEFGESGGVFVEGTGWDGTEYEYGIALSNFRRGDEAKKIALDNNQFNEIPEGQEAIVFDVAFLLTELSSKNDDSFWVSYYDFEYYTSNFASFSGGSLVGSDNEFSGDLYEGAKLLGDVIMCIPEGDQGYLLFKDFVWFRLP